MGALGAAGQVLVLTAWTSALLVTHLGGSLSRDHYYESRSTARQNEGKPARPLERVYIATGANSEYFKALQNFVGSVRFYCPECHVLVYNLGLSEAEKASVRCVQELKTEVLLLKTVATTQRMVQHVTVIAKWFG